MRRPPSAAPLARRPEFWPLSSIFVAHAPASAMRQEVSSDRFGFYLATHPCTTERYIGCRQNPKDALMIDLKSRAGATQAQDQRTPTIIRFITRAGARLSRFG
jgi:hypothetical protein